jgi:hypothetical protein
MSCTFQRSRPREPAAKCRPSLVLREVAEIAALLRFSGQETLLSRAPSRFPLIVIGGRDFILVQHRINPQTPFAAKVLDPIARGEFEIRHVHGQPAQIAGDRLFCHLNRGGIQAWQSGGAFRHGNRAQHRKCRAAQQWVQGSCRLTFPQDSDGRNPPSGGCRNFGFAGLVAGADVSTVEPASGGRRISLCRSEW